MASTTRQVLALIVAIASVTGALPVPMAGGADGPGRSIAPMSTSLEWRDDLNDTSRMSSYEGINVTDGRVELNLTRGLERVDGDLRPYPTIVYSGSGFRSGLSPPDAPNVTILYPVSDRSGYRLPTVLTFANPPANYTAGVDIADIDADGYQDLAVVVGWSVRILWGDATEIWSAFSETTVIDARNASDVCAGDVDGDGDLDIAIACSMKSSYSDALVYLNVGDRSFADEPELTVVDGEIWRVEVIDLDADGFDDVVFIGRSEHRVFYGGPTGLSTDRNAIISHPNGFDDIFLGDLNWDGWPDMVQIGGWTLDFLRIFLGSTSGFKAEPDYCITSISTGVDSLSVGDINDDGYIDLIIGLYYDYAAAYEYIINVAEGIPEGHSNTDLHHLGNDMFPYAVDIDRDGYDDILTMRGCYRGGSSWPLGEAVQLAPGSGRFMVTAAPRLGSDHRVTTFNSELIDINATQRWDYLSIDAKVPEHTSVQVSITDSEGRELGGFRNMRPSTVDLSTLTWQGPIRLKVRLISGLHTTTPSVESMVVMRRATGSWSESFANQAKVDTLINLAVQKNEALGYHRAMSAVPQILVTAWSNPISWWVDVHPPTKALIGTSDLDFNRESPLVFNVTCTNAVDSADINNDGFEDLIFAVGYEGGDWEDTHSPLFLGSAAGWGPVPYKEFVTDGPTDVLLEDLNGDGEFDVLFLQVYGPALLFWGMEGPEWNSTPDVKFGENRSIGVAAEDFNGDGRIDLAFAQGRDNAIYLQSADGYNGSSPDQTLKANGIIDIGSGDLNGDGWPDLVLVNYTSLKRDDPNSTDSYIFWGCEGGVFQDTPSRLRTYGATDVEVADLDVDGDLDILIQSAFKAQAFIFIYDAIEGLPYEPTYKVETNSNCDLTITDLDNRGYLDLVVARCGPGDDRSVVYLGGDDGWPTEPSFQLPTVWATDALVKRLINPGNASYTSRPFPLEATGSTETCATVRYTALLEAGLTGEVRLVDATSNEVIARTALQNGTNEWRVTQLQPSKGYPSLRFVMTVSGLEEASNITIDDLSVGWDIGVGIAPAVVDMGVEHGMLKRLETSELWVQVLDDKDAAGSLDVTVELRPSGTEDWGTGMLGELAFSDGAWRATVTSAADAAVGAYDARVRATDSDGMTSGSVVFTSVLTLLNNLPTAPVVRITPSDPTTRSSLKAEIVTASSDADSTALEYVYQWYRDGSKAGTGDTVAGYSTRRGQNWSVEVTAHDGLDEGPAGTAWVVIGNAAPVVVKELEDVVITAGMTAPRTVDLYPAFEDPEGELLSWGVRPMPLHILVSINGTGNATLGAAANWTGQENVTFVASDGELEATQTITVTVVALNHPPSIVKVNGKDASAGPIRIEVEANQSLELKADCEDPEEPYGQELGFTWSSNVSGVLGSGRSINVTFTTPGMHNITLTVTDGELTATYSFLVVVSASAVPPPVPDSGGEVPWAPILAILVVIGAVVLTLLQRSRGGRPQGRGRD